MTHLGNTINRLMLEQPRLNGTMVAKKAGIDRSFFFRLVKGYDINVAPKHLLNVARAVGRTRAEQAEIVAARMKDIAGEFYPKLIQVSVSEKESPSHLNPDIEYLQKHLEDQNIRYAVRALVALHKMAKSETTKR